MKYLPLLLLLATACGSKKEDPAVVPNPDVVPAGQHLIKVTYTGSGWSASPGLYIFQSTSNTAGKVVYKTVLESWSEATDATNGHSIRLAYRDTAFALHFYAGASTRPCGGPVPATTAKMRYQIFVDGRDQGVHDILGTDACGDRETLIDPKNLK